MFANNISSFNIAANTLSTNRLFANNISSLNIQAQNLSSYTLYTNTVLTSNIYASTLNVSTIYQNFSLFYPDDDSGAGGMVFTNLSGDTTATIINNYTTLQFTIYSIDFLILRSDTDIKIDAPTIDISANNILVHTIVGGSISIDAPTIDISANYINTNAFMSTNYIQADTINAKTAMTAPQTSDRTNVATNYIIPYYYTDPSYVGVNTACSSNVYTKVTTSNYTQTFPYLIPNVIFSNYRAHIGVKGFFPGNSNTLLNYYFAFSNSTTITEGNTTNSNFPYTLNTLGSNVSFGYTDTYDLTSFNNTNYSILLYMKPISNITFSNYIVSATFEPYLSL